MSTITQTDLSSRWESLSPEDVQLKDVDGYVALETIDSDIQERQLLCKNCSEVVYFHGNQEIGSMKECSGLMKLPAGISVKIYKGRYSVK